MPIITRRVQVYAGVTMFSATQGAIDIDEERKTLQISTVDAQGNRLETIMSAPLADVAVRGSATRLRFTINGQTKWVDFSMGASLVQGFGIAGEIAGGVMNKNSGVTEVVAALKAGGAQVRYWSYLKRIGVAWAIAGGIVLIVIIAVVAAALGGQ